MNDFELHELCSFYPGLTSYEIDIEKELYNSCKILEVMKLLKEFKANGDRVLIFSTWRIIIDIVKEVINRNNYKFLQLDGSTKVEERQGLIDQYNEDQSILIFFLTNKAGILIL